MHLNVIIVKKQYMWPLNVTFKVISEIYNLIKVMYDIEKPTYNNSDFI